MTRISKAGRKPRKPTQERARATVDAIIEAAGQLLVSKGRAAVTTNAVAERAGVSIGSLYQYFPHKEAIFQALQERHRDEVMPLIHHSLDNLAADVRLDVVESIVTLLRGLMELHEEHRVAPLFVDAVEQILAVRIRRPPDRVRAMAWLVCETVTHVGWTLVHIPPPVDLEEVLAGVRRMLRGLLAGR